MASIEIQGVFNDERNYESEKEYDNATQKKHKKS